MNIAFYSTMFKTLNFMGSFRQCSLKKKAEMSCEIYVIITLVNPLHDKQTMKPQM